VSSRSTRSPKLYPFECICPPHTAEDFAGRGFLLQRVLVSWNGPRHPRNFVTHHSVFGVRDFGQGCHGLHELFSAVTRAVGSALNPPLLFQEKGTGDELRGKLSCTHSHRFRGARVLGCSACWCRGVVHDTPGTSSLIMRCLVFDILARGVTAYADYSVP
jgi:hypothetical protein